MARYAIEKFVGGELHPDSSGVVFYLGEKEPTGFRYPQAGERHEVDPGDIPW